MFHLMDVLGQRMAGQVKTVWMPDIESGGGDMRRHGQHILKYVQSIRGLPPVPKNPAHLRSPLGAAKMSTTTEKQKHNEVRGDCVCASVLFPYRIVRDQGETLQKKFK